MIDFFASGEKLNLSYLIKYIKDMMMTIGLLFLAYFIQHKYNSNADINADIKMVIAISIFFGWIYLIAIFSQPFFIIIRNCKGFRNCMKKISIISLPLCYVVLFAIAFAFVIFFKNTL